MALTYSGAVTAPRVCDSIDSAVVSSLWGDFGVLVGVFVWFGRDFGRDFGVHFGWLALDTACLGAFVGVAGVLKLVVEIGADRGSLTPDCSLIGIDCEAYSGISH